MGGRTIERKTTSTCRRCNRIVYSPISIKQRLCGLCHRKLRASFTPKVLQYLLSRGLSLD